MLGLDLLGIQEPLDPFDGGEYLNDGRNRVGQQSDGILQTSKDHDGGKSHFGVDLVAEQYVGDEGATENEWAGQPVDKDIKNIHEPLFLIILNFLPSLPINLIEKILLNRIYLYVSYYVQHLLGCPHPVVFLLKDLPVEEVTPL